MCISDNDNAEKPSLNEKEQLIHTIQLLDLTHTHTAKQNEVMDIINFTPIEISPLNYYNFTPNLAYWVFTPLANQGEMPANDKIEKEKITRSMLSS